MEFSSRPILLAPRDIVDGGLMTSSKRNSIPSHTPFGVLASLRELTILNYGFLALTDTTAYVVKKDYCPTVLSLLMNGLFWNNQHFCIPVWPSMPFPFLPSISVNSFARFSFLMTLDSAVLATKFSMIAAGYELWKYQPHSGIDVQLNSCSLSLVETPPLSSAVLMQTNAVSDESFTFQEMMDVLHTTQFLGNSLSFCCVAVDWSFVQSVSRYRTTEQYLLRPVLESAYFLPENHLYLGDLFSDLLNYSCSGKNEQVCGFSGFENSYVESSFDMESASPKMSNFECVHLNLGLCNIPHDALHYPIALCEVEDCFSMFDDRNYMPHCLVSSFGIKTTLWTAFTGTRLFVSSLQLFTDRFLIQLCNICGDWDFQEEREKGQLVFVKEILCGLMQFSFSFEEALTTGAKELSRQGSRDGRSFDIFTSVGGSSYFRAEAMPHNVASSSGTYLRLTVSLFHLFRRNVS
jgi:hypothetical protein